VRTITPCLWFDGHAISFLVPCDTQAAVDELWAKLSAGGEPGRCGWLADRVMTAMLEMGKIEIDALRRAYDSQESAP
jgi:predicted 3-demethylubiquinone-9 3-methyltransferase (glyoxalase superfamily)